MIVNLPMKLYCDKKVASNTVHNPVMHEKTKNVEIDKHFIKEKHDEGVICTPFVPSTLKVADILTKGLSKTFEEQVEHDKYFCTNLKGVLIWLDLIGIKFDMIEYFPYVSQICWDVISLFLSISSVPPTKKWYTEMKEVFFLLQSVVFLFFSNLFIWFIECCSWNQWVFVTALSYGYFYGMTNRRVLDIENALFTFGYPLLSSYFSFCLSSLKITTRSLDTPLF